MKLYAYYPTWAVHTITPANLKFPAGIETIYMHFSAHVSNVSPYFGPAIPGHSDIADLTTRQAELITACHANNSKVLLSITAQGGDGTALDAIAKNPTQRQTLVTAISTYCRSKGYDGVDIDWENGLSSTGVRELIKALREEFNRWPTPGIVVMATLTDPFTYSVWDFYDIAAMNQYLDAYFGMDYGMTGVEREANALGNAGSIWRCGFDCPLDRPTGAPWNGFTGGYWMADVKNNTLTKWLAKGASVGKLGFGLWNGGSTMLNSSSSSRPGSIISYGAAGFVNYGACLNATNKTYDAQADHWWGIVNGLYCTWIDPQGAFNRVKWAKQQGCTVFMLYDVVSGYVNGQQPHFDKMVEAMLEGSVPVAPTGSFTVTPTSLPAGGGNVSVSVTSQNAEAATINGVLASPNGVTAFMVSASTTINVTLVGDGGTTILPVVSVTVALPQNCQAEYERGRAEGYTSGYEIGYDNGYTDGYNAGKADAALISGVARITDQNGKQYEFNLSLRQ